MEENFKNIEEQRAWNNDSMWSAYSDEFMEYLCITEDQVTDLQWHVTQKNNSL